MLIFQVETALNATNVMQSDDDWMLGYPREDDWIQGPRALAVQERYRESLQQAAKALQSKNAAYRTSGAHHFVSSILDPTNITSCVGA